MITAQQVADAQFDEARGTAGFDALAVDDFLDRVIDTLRHVESGKSLPSGSLTARQVVETEFPEVTNVTPGGYNMDQVDDLLDLVAQRLHAYETGGTQEVEHDRTDAHAAQTSQPTPAETVVPTDAEVKDADAPAQTRSEEPVAGRGEGHTDAQVDEQATSVTRAKQDWDPFDGREAADATRTDATPGETVTPAAASSTSSTSLGDDYAASQHVDHTSVSDEPARDAQGNPVPSYPAKEHSVPLPTGASRSKLSEADVEAEANYHPEYSEYTSGAASWDEPRASETHAAPEVNEPIATRMDASAVNATQQEAQERPATEQVDARDAEIHEPVASPAAGLDAIPSESTASETTASETVTPSATSETQQAKSTLPLRDSVTGERTDGTSSVSTPGPEVTRAEQLETQPHQSEAERPLERQPESPVAPKADAVKRPEPIDRPQSIDSPRPVPTRPKSSQVDDKVAKAKSLLCRLFRSGK